MKILGILAVSLSCVMAEKIKIGDLVTLSNNVGGAVSAVDDNTIAIDNFKYDGTGGDTFLCVGIEGNPSSTNEDKTYILDPTGETFKYRDQSAPVLGRYHGVKIILKMPPNMKVGDLKWISVLNRKFSNDFGHLIFPDNLGLSKTEDSNKNDEIEVNTDPETETEHEPEGGGSDTVLPGVVSLLVLLTSLLL